MTGWNLSVISAGTEYPLSDNRDYVLTGLDGIAGAPVERITEQGPMQHGVSDRGYRLRPRKLVLALSVRCGDAADWFARRHELLRMFRPGREPVRLRLTSGPVVRQIDCHIDGTLEMTPDVNWGTRWQRVGIELYAPDPTWYDPAGRTAAFSLGGGGLLAIPLAVPMAVGSSTIDQSLQIKYEGTWDAAPIITLRGPMTDPVITNQTLGDKLDFTGTSIAAGNSYVIDCRYGYKTVTRTSDGANRIQDLTHDSDLATFRIGAHPDVRDGYNSIRVSASGLTVASVVYLQYYTRYIGV